MKTILDVCKNRRLQTGYINYQNHALSESIIYMAGRNTRGTARNHVSSNMPDEHNDMGIEILDDPGPKRQKRGKTKQATVDSEQSEDLNSIDRKLVEAGIHIEGLSVVEKKIFVDVINQSKEDVNAGCMPLNEQTDHNNQSLQSRGHATGGSQAKIADDSDSNGGQTSGNRETIRSRPGGRSRKLKGAKGGKEGNLSTKGIRKLVTKKEESRNDIQILTDEESSDGMVHISDGEHVKNVNEIVSKQCGKEDTIDNLKKHESSTVANDSGPDCKEDTASRDSDVILIPGISKIGADRAVTISGIMVEKHKCDKEELASSHERPFTSPVSQQLTSDLSEADVTLVDSDQETQPPDEAESPSGLDLNSSTLAADEMEDGDLSEENQETVIEGIDIADDGESQQSNGEIAPAEMPLPRESGEEDSQSDSQSNEECLKDSPPISSQKSGGFNIELPSEFRVSQSASQSSQSIRHSDSQQAGRSNVDGELVRHYIADQNKHVRRCKFYRDPSVDGNNLTECIRRIRLQFDKSRVGLRKAQRKLSEKIPWEDWNEPVKQGQHVPGSLDLKARGRVYMDMDIFNEHSQSSNEGPKERVQRSLRHTSLQQKNPYDRSAFIFDDTEEDDFESLQSLRNQTMKNRKAGNKNSDEDDDNLPDLIVEPDNMKKASTKTSLHAETQGFVVEDKENLHTFDDEVKSNRKNALGSGSKAGISVCKMPALKLGGDVGQTTRATRNSKPPVAEADNFEADLEKAIQMSKKETFGNGSQFEGCDNQENDSDYLSIQRGTRGSKFENQLQKAKLKHFSIPKVTITSVSNKDEENLTCKETQTLQKNECKDTLQKNKVSDEFYVPIIGRTTSNARGENKPKDGPKSKLIGRKNASSVLAAETQDLDLISPKKHNKIERETFKFQDDSDDETIAETQKMDISSEKSDKQDFYTKLSSSSVEMKPEDKEEKRQGLMGRAKGAVNSFMNLFSSSDTNAMVSEGTKRKADSSDISVEVDEGSQSPVLKKKTRRLINPDAQRLIPTCPLVREMLTSKSSVGKESQRLNSHGINGDFQKQTMPKGAGWLSSRPVSSESKHSDGASLASSQGSCGVLFDENGEIYGTQKCEIQRRLGMDVKGGKLTQDPSDLEEDVENILSLDDDSDEDPLAEFKQTERTYSRKGNTTDFSFRQYSLSKAIKHSTQATVTVNSAVDTQKRVCNEIPQTTFQSLQPQRRLPSTSHIDLDPDLNRSRQMMPSMSEWVAENDFTESPGADVGHRFSTSPTLEYVASVVVKTPSQEKAVTCPLCNKDFPVNVIEMHASTCRGPALEEEEENEEPIGPSLPPDLEAIFEIPQAESSSDGTRECALCTRKFGSEDFKKHFTDCYKVTMQQQAEIETKGFNQTLQPETVEPRITRLRGSPFQAEKPHTANSSENDLPVQRVLKGKTLGFSHNSMNTSRPPHAHSLVNDEDDDLIITDVQPRSGLELSRGQGHMERGGGRGMSRSRRPAALDQGYKSEANKENESESSDESDGSSFSASDSYSSSDDDQISLKTVIRSGSSSLITGPWNKNIQHVRTSNQSGENIGIHEPDWLRNPSNSPIKSFVPISEQEDAEYFKLQFRYNKDRTENRYDKRKRDSGHKRGRRKRRKVKRKKRK
ncbi:uncharacterized protein LOC127841556 isoform X2 [Dreissena polymorpha]|uniref:uncharacterized protein LOC127841556 isoform X2 n=1 Tax=Dreissena polymorpha TaxID=45954 RepID=UPI002263CA06|nr:uncharacterized protein LOC127841556 isoform X2 [Dreissena polymorpha]